MGGRGWLLATWAAVCLVVFLGSVPATAGPFGFFRRTALVVDQKAKQTSVVTVRRGWIVESKPVEGKAATKAVECQECQKAGSKPAK